MSGIPTNGGLGDYQTNTDQHIVFNNVTLDNSKKYYIYIASEYASSQPIPPLLTGYEPLFVCCVQPQYPPPNNFVYINKKEILGEKLSHTDFFKFSMFYDLLLKSNKLQTVFKDLAKRQGNLWIKPFRNDPSFAPQFQDSHYKCLGLTSEQSDRLNNKVFQYLMFDRKLSLPNYKIVPAQDAENNFNNIKSSNGVFIAGAYGAGGSTTFVAKTKKELKKQLNERKFSLIENIVLAECLDLKQSLSIDLLIANRHEILPFCILGQTYDENNKLECKGNAYPANISAVMQKKVKDLAYEAGKTLAVEEGVRGHVSLDLNIDQNDEVYFGEINARYTAATAERFLLMELTRPSGYPTLIDLEKMAIEKGTFTGLKLWKEPTSLYIKRREMQAREKGVVIVAPKDSCEDEKRIFELRKPGIIGALPVGKKVSTEDTIGKYVAIGETSEECDSQIKNLETQLAKSIQYKF